MNDDHYHEKICHPRTTGHKRETENISYCWSQDLHLELKIVADKHTTFFLLDG